MIASRQTRELERELGLYDSRVDLRGFAFPKPSPKGKIDFPGFDIESVERLEIGQLDMTSYDFSFADLSGVMWTSCSFTKCRFDLTQMSSSLFYNCEFVRCSFNNCDLTGAVLGGHIGRKSGRIVDTEFRGGRFREVAFSFPRIEKCHFECNISKVDFDGSQLANCRFAGVLDCVTFRRKYRPLATDRRSALSHLPENRMKNVDFSESVFRDVNFRGGLRLDSCTMPRSGDVLLIPDAPSVLERVRHTVSLNWTGEDRRIGVEYLDMELSDLKKDGQTDFVLNGGMLMRVWGKQLGERFLALVMDTMSSSVDSESLQ